MPTGATGSVEWSCRQIISRGTRLLSAGIPGTRFSEGEGLFLSRRPSTSAVRAQGAGKCRIIVLQIRDCPIEIIDWTLKKGDLSGSMAYRSGGSRKGWIKPRMVEYQPESALLFSRTCFTTLQAFDWQLNVPIVRQRLLTRRSLPGYLAVRAFSVEVRAAMKLRRKEFIKRALIGAPRRWKLGLATGAGACSLEGFQSLLQSVTPLRIEGSGSGATLCHVGAVTPRCATFQEASDPRRVLRRTQPT